MDGIRKLVKRICSFSTCVVASSLGSVSSRCFAGQEEARMAVRAAPAAACQTADGRPRKPQRGRTVKRWSHLSFVQPQPWLAVAVARRVLDRTRCSARATAKVKFRLLKLSSLTTFFSAFATEEVSLNENFGIWTFQDFGTRSKKSRKDPMEK